MAWLTYIQVARIWEVRCCAKRQVIKTCIIRVQGVLLNKPAGGECQKKLCWGLPPRTAVSSSGWSVLLTVWNSMSPGILCHLCSKLFPVNNDFSPQKDHLEITGSDPMSSYSFTICQRSKWAAEPFLTTTTTIRWPSLREDHRRGKFEKWQRSFSPGSTHIPRLVGIAYLYYTTRLEINFLARANGQRGWQRYWTCKLQPSNI